LRAIVIRRPSAGSILTLSATCVTALLLLDIHAAASQQRGSEPGSTELSQARSAGQAEGLRYAVARLEEYMLSRSLGVLPATSSSPM
jgi:hypothetical protein